MDEVPSPWQELFEIFNLDPNPIESARFWLIESRFSRLYSQPAQFDHFLLYLVHPVPCINNENSLVMRPRLSELPSKIRDLTIEFLFQNYDLASKQSIDLICSRAERSCYSTDDRRVFVKLKSKHSALNRYNSVPHDGVKVPIKRSADNNQMTDSPPSKRVRTDEPDAISTGLNDAASFCNEDFYVAIQNKDVDKLFLLLETSSESFLENACDAVLHGHVIDEAFFSEASARLLEMDPGHDLVVEKFMKYPSCIMLKQMKENLNRESVQRLTQITKKHPRLMTEQLLCLFVRQLSVINSAQVNLLTTISKQALTDPYRLELFRACVDNKSLLESSFDPVLSLFLTFSSSPLRLEEKDQVSLCHIFKCYSQPASKTFLFAKLLLTFLKKHANNLSPANHDLLTQVIEVNNTALKPACKAALLKLK